MQKGRDGFAYGTALEISAEGREPRGGGLKARVAYDFTARILQQLNQTVHRIRRGG
jgi:hypothetical protein